MSLLTIQRAYLIGAALVIWAGGLLVAAGTSLAFGAGVGWASVGSAALFTLVTIYWIAGLFFPNHRPIEFRRAIVASAGIIAVSLLVATAVYDSSWDGQTYHAEGLLAIADGWNPYRNPISPGSAFGHWQIFHSKGAWLAGGSIVAAAGHPEAGKALNFVLAVASYALALPALVRIGVSQRPRILFGAALIALNPVVVSQLFTYYVDGLLASALSITVCLLILFDKWPNWITGIPLIAASLLVMSVKLHGAIYLTMIALGFAAWHWISRRRGGWLLLACGLFVYLIGISLNANPFISHYGRRFAETGSPFRENDFVVLNIYSNTPEAFRDRGWMEKFTVSLFSRYDYGRRVELKVPLTLSAEEIGWMFDARVSGFGPFFSGGILFTAVALIAGLRHLSAPSYPWIILIVTALSVISNPEAWWARYVPQVWLVVVLIALLPARSNNRWMRLWQRAALAILAFNVLWLLVMALLGAANGNRLATTTIAELRARPTTPPIEIDFAGAALTRAHIDRAFIPYIEVNELSCPYGTDRLWPSPARICRE